MNENIYLQIEIEEEPEIIFDYDKPSEYKRNSFQWKNISWKFVISIIIYIGGMIYIFPWLINFIAFRKSPNLSLQFMSLLSLGTFIVFSVTFIISLCIDGIFMIIFRCCLKLISGIFAVN